ncbi:unnamed protein product [Tuber aestivum]|uniref:HMG box domain-containing protein n=1 Tax=Tuber aestivum TaxID=59557 RepID=A0A292Q065_9PEZI|nr:unnamed protein product [Tuber aestivum]
MARSGKEKAIAPASIDVDELVRLRDSEWKCSLLRLEPHLILESFCHSPLYPTGFRTLEFRYALLHVGYHDPHAADFCTVVVVVVVVVVVCVTSMTVLRNSADEASRAIISLFNHFIASGSDQQQQSHALFQRGPTEEPEGPKRRARRPKRDPAMPKRPMTAYLLFCHQGRDTVKADLGPDATHKDVLAELTKRWSDTPDDQKKAWQDLYQKNREVYAKDMALYKAAKELASGESSAVGFTAVNTELENPQESDAESDKVVDENGESEAEVGVEDEEEEEEEEEVRSPTPPPRKKTTPRGKKATATNGNLRGTLNSVAVAPPASAIVDGKANEPAKRKRASRKKVIEEEPIDEVAPRKKATRKRRKSSD